MNHPANQFWNGLRDFIVLVIVFAITNYLLHRKDLGWLHLNPTPWLVPVALIGARYGFVGGLFSGLLVSLAIAFVRSSIEEETVRSILRQHDFTLLAIVIAGAATGEIGSVLRRRRYQREADRTHAAEENARLHAQLQIVDETRHSLQRQLALYNAPIAALDDDLRQLFKQPNETFLSALLELLHRVTGITSAGIYRVKGTVLELEGVIHPTAPLKQSLALADTPIAVSSLESRKLVSVKSAVDLSAEQPFLAALPFGESQIILIQDMPYESFNLRHLARVELILNWTNAIHSLDLQSSRQNVPHQVFYSLMERAHEADAHHAMPSSLLHVESTQAHDVSHIAGAFAGTAILTRLAKPNSLAVLLPFSGHGEADKLVAELTRPAAGQRAHHYLLTRDVQLKPLWELLNARTPV